MNSMGDIIPEAILPDGEPWRNLLKGDAYQAGPPPDRGRSVARTSKIWRRPTRAFRVCHRQHFHRRRTRRLAAASIQTHWPIAEKVPVGGISQGWASLPLWDKTRWIIRCSKGPYFRSYQSNPPVVFPLYDCQAYFDYLHLYRTCAYVEDDTEETEELQRRFSLKRVAGKYPEMPDIREEL